MSTQRKLPIFDMGLERFREVIIDGTKPTATLPAPPAGLGPAIRDTLLATFKAAREARSSLDAPLVRHATRMLTELGLHATHASVYRPVFEAPFLAATAAFYAAESAASLAAMPAPEYLRYASERLRFEAAHVAVCLEDATAGELRARLQGELVAAHAVALVEADERGGLGRMLAAFDAEGGGGAASGGGGLGGDSAGAGSSGRAGSGAGPFSAGAGASSSSGGGGGGGVGSSSSSSSSSKTTADVALLYSLFRDVKAQVVWRGPADPTAALAAGGGGGGGGCAWPHPRPTHPVGMLREVLKAHIVARGVAIVIEPESKRQPVQFVQALIDLRDRYTLLIDEACGGDKEFHRALKEAFECVLNNEDLAREAAAQGDDGGGARAPHHLRSQAVAPNVCAEYLSVYVDDMMKGGFRSLDEAAVERALDKVITLFRFIREKDVFEAHYKSHLQRRLLSGRSTSDEAERCMLSKLKQECGMAFTSKLEGMFNDLRTAAEFMVRACAHRARARARHRRRRRRRGVRRGARRGL